MRNRQLTALSILTEDGSKSPLSRLCRRLVAIQRRSPPIRSKTLAFIESHFKYCAILGWCLAIIIDVYAIFYSPFGTIARVA